jgi:ketosteroid isomerase-like protein
MRRIIIICYLITTALAIGFGQSASQKPSRQSVGEQELRKIEELRRQAIKQGDMKTLDAIYADDFTAIAGNGQEINKQKLLEVFKRNDPRVEFTTDEIKVRVFGTTAIFTGRLTGKTKDGEVISASRFSHLFVKRKGKWECVAGQSTAIPKQS